jgi:hypothetical protein
MNKIYFLILIASTISSCKSQKDFDKNSNSGKTISLTDCLPDAKCTLQVTADMGVIIKKDEIGNLNLIFEPKPNTTAYHYIMSENHDQQYMDAGYREEIAFELPSDFKNGTISGKQLIDSGALFGVFCYCKGKAGYYAIRGGTITKSADSITVEVPSIVEGQKLRSITFKSF